MSTQEKARRRGTPRPGFIRKSWREKVHPAYAAWCSSQKKNRALAEVSDPGESKRRFDEWLREAAPLSRAMNEARRTVKNSMGAKLLNEIVRGLKFHDFDDRKNGDGQEGIGIPVNPESSPFFWHLVFMKYGITFRDLVRQVAIEKSPVAQRKLMAVHRDSLLSKLGFERRG